MPDNKELFAALIRAHAEMGNAPKDGRNPHFKSQYATLQSVVDTVRPVLAKHGLSFIQKFHDPENGGVAIETIIIHETGQELGTGIFRVPATKQDAQGYGSALSYCKRYSLQTAFGIASEDDDGNAACAPAQAKRPGNGNKPAPAPTEEQVLNGVLSQIWATCQAKGMDKPAMLQSMSDLFQRPIASSADLTLTDAREFLEVLKDG